MTLTIQWYGRHEDFKPNYSEEHHGTISGETAAECMLQLAMYRRNHDLAKFTPIAIVYVAD